MYKIKFTINFINKKQSLLYIKPMNSTTLHNEHTDDLLEELRSRLASASKEPSLALQAEGYSPIEDAGQRIREERRKQRLTMNDLCELSGVAYATLSKIEQGFPGVNLNSLGKVAMALGLKLWLG